MSWRLGAADGSQQVNDSDAAADAEAGDPASLLLRRSAPASTKEETLVGSIASLSVEQRVAAAREYVALGEQPRAGSRASLRPTTADAGSAAAAPALQSPSPLLPTPEAAAPAAPRAPNSALALVVLPPPVEPAAQSALMVAGSRAVVARTVAKATAAKVRLRARRAAFSCSLCCAARPQLHESAEAGLQQVIDAMKEHLWVSNVQEAGLLALSNLAAKVERGFSLACAAAGLRACVAAMQAHTRNEALQRQALTALRQLAALVEPGEVFDDGIEAVVAVAHAHAHSAPMQELCMRTLASLLAEEEQAARSREIAVAVGALEAAAAAMSQHPQVLPVQHASLTVTLLLVTMHAEALASVVPGDPEKEHARVARGVAAGAGPAALSALRAHAAHAPVLHAACRVLRCLAAEDEGAAAAAAAAGAAEALVHALRMHRDDVELGEVAPAALRPLLASAAGKRRAAAAGALESLCLAMFAFPASRPVQAACAGAIKSLAVEEEARQRPAAAAAVEGLVKALGVFGGGRAGLSAAAGDTAAAAFAADAVGALANLMTGSPENQERMRDADGAAVLVDVLQSHLASADVCEAVCAALWALAVCSDDDTLRHIGEAGGADAVVRAMRAHAAEPRVQRVAALALRNVCVLAETAAAAAGSGAVEALLAGLRLHGGSAALQEGLLDALSALCEAGGERVAALAAAEGGLLVTAAARETRFPHHAGVQRAAAAVEALVEPHGWDGRGARLKSTQM